MDRRQQRKQGGPIPPRWLNCPRKSQALIGGKFLAFKTPLSDSYDDKVPEESRFYPTMLLASMSSYKVKMGLWVDLTKTSRFYNKQEIESAGIKYFKLECKGHEECPTDEQTTMFVRLCHQFISHNPLNVIGVHCTHGFNRTGFLIISYLVENLDWSVDAAVQEFSRARPPGIYKEEYLRALYVKYGDPNDTPLPPPLPDWCTESDDTVDDDGEQANNHRDGPPTKKRREFMKKNPVFMEGVPGVVPVTDQRKLSEVQARCQQICEWKSSGFPGSQPVSMDITNLKLLRAMNYKVSWKADGTRYMMLIENRNNVFFIDRDNCVFKVSGIVFPQRKAPSDHICDTLLDGEMVLDKTDGKCFPRYLVYDIVRFQGLEVGKTPFERRLYCIEKEIIQPRTEAKKDGKIDGSREPFSVRIKNFFDLTKAQSLLSDKFTEQLGHEVDGLIFQPNDEPYIAGTCPHVLKWKPETMNSVDFRLKITKEHKPGMLPETKGYLYVGGFEPPLSEIKVNKALKEFDNKIIECKFEANKWVFMRERTDKSFPNSYKTAMAVCESIRNPVTKDRLLEDIDRFRFRPPVTGDDRTQAKPPAASRPPVPRPNWQ